MSTIHVIPGLCHTGGLNQSIPREAIKDELTDQAFGVIGEFVVTQMVNAVAGAPVLSTDGPQAAGSKAHAELDKSIKENSKQLNKYLRKFGARLETEVFRYQDGSRTANNGRNRSKGAMGLDVTVINIATDKVLLAFDLKTGRAGTTKGKLPGYRRSHSNAPIIDIFVSRK